MPTPLSVLLIEDSETDAQLVLDEIRRGGYEPAFKRIATAPALKAALKRQSWEVIIADYRMSELSGIAALEILKSSGLDIPLIIVSGTVGVEEAVEAMKEGASDYLIQNRLSRLPTAVAQALESKRGRDARERTQQRLLLQSSSMQMAANAVLITDPQGNILWVNPAFSAMTGYASDEVLGQTPRLLHSGLHIQYFYRDLWRTLLAGQTWKGEFINRRKDGSLFYGEQTITPVRELGGPITHFIGIMDDVTGRRLAEDELRSGYEQLQHILEQSPAVQFSMKLEADRWGLVLVSENVRRLLGYTAEEACAADWWSSHLHPEDCERASAITSATLEHGTSNSEYRIQRRDGHFLRVADSRRVVRNESGQPVEIAGAWMDLTKRNRTEASPSDRRHELER